MIMFQSSFCERVKKGLKYMKCFLKVPGIYIVGERADVYRYSVGFISDQRHEVKRRYFVRAWRPLPYLTNTTGGYISSIRA